MKIGYLDKEVTQLIDNAGENLLLNKKNNYMHGSLRILQDLFSFEILFVLFIFAGLYKADPRLTWVPIDLTALFFGLSVIAGFFILARKGFILKRKSMELVLLYMVFAGYALLTYLWTPGKVYSTHKVLYLWTLTFWALAASALIISTDFKRFKRLGQVFIIFSVIVSIEAIIQYHQVGQAGFIKVFGSNYLGFGRVVGLSFILAFCYFIFWSQNFVEKSISIGLAGLFFWILLIGGGRGPLIAAIIAAMIPVCFALRIDFVNKTLSIRKYVYPIIIISIIVVIGFIGLYDSGQITLTMKRLLVLTSDGMGNSAAARIHFYHNSIEYWKQSPLIGNGIGSWPILNKGIDARGYPHNLILEILVELGIVGLMIFMGFFSYAMLFIIPKKKNPMQMLLLMLIVYVFVRSMFSGDVSENRLLFCCIGLMPAGLIMGDKL